MGAEQSKAIQDEVANGSAKVNQVGFFINGKEYSVKTENGPFGEDSKLVDFIRDKAGLKGTKYMCREGGCGACTVSVKSRDPQTGSDVIRSVNSCLVPLLSADGWEITTVEGLGDKKDGYHPIQQRIVHFSATQCGFCTPGMAMNMYSLAESQPNFKKKDVEDTFDGNICRCTGYRPILDAFKSLASDAPPELRQRCLDIEDFKRCPLNKSRISSDFEHIGKSSLEPRLYLKLQTGAEWIKVSTLNEAFEQLQRFATNEAMYRIVGGNTGTGVFKNEGPYTAFVDINGIPELKQTTLKTSTTPNELVIGSGLTLTAVGAAFISFANRSGFEYLEKLVKHLMRVANTSVRNVGTIGGNLMLKHNHNEFPSDVFTLLEAVGAKITIASSSTMSRYVDLVDFLSMNMTGMLITSISLPAVESGKYSFRSFKVTRRYQNAHAYVNGAILMEVTPQSPFTVVSKPRIVYGGISPNFIHASRTEEYLEGKPLNNATIKGAMDTLEAELQPDSVNVLDGSPEYRKTLAQSLLFKTIVGVLGTSVRKELQTGGQDLEHELTSGKQTYSSDQSQWPLYQPIPKIEATVQASGEAEYINDIHPSSKELFGAFVVTTVASATLKNVDASEALMRPGVVSFITAKDVPGTNAFFPFYMQTEEIFIKDKVSFAGQAVGLILAESRELAFEAVKKVKVTYDGVKPPVIGLAKVVKASEAAGNLEECFEDTFEVEESSSPPGGNVSELTKIAGTFEVGGQYHLSMETQTCLCIPTEDGMDVFCSTQFPDIAQQGISNCLGLPMHDIRVMVRRLGGAYGCKITKANQTACACAVAAFVTNRPVRIVLDLETNMRMIGKRLPYLTKYQAQVDENGVIKSLKADIFCDTGFTGNESTSRGAVAYFQNCYNASGWKVKNGKGLTNTHANTYCRAPGTTQGVASIELVMEHIAHVLQKDPLEVRRANMIKSGDKLLSTNESFVDENPLPQIIQDLQNSAKYTERKAFVNSFNQANRFRKRGLCLLPMKYVQDLPQFDLRFPVFISVYQSDGTIAVSHAGVEMGQGLNTKVAQVVAKFLGVPLEKIRVKPTDTVVSPNGGCTGGAIGSELVCSAAVGACESLLAKMAPGKAAAEKEAPNPSWETIVQKCHELHILLTSQFQDTPGKLKGYNVWGATLTEVEVDVLTGEYKVVRVDLFEDAGSSLSPDVDIGQIEGAFVMGLGLWTTEKLVWDESSGQLLTTSTWDYKVPLPKDIPEDFRVTMAQNRPNPFGVLRSKATGEPPLVMSSSVLFAIRNAIDAARKDAGDSSWYELNGPVTPEDIHRLAKATPDQFTL